MNANDIYGGNNFNIEKAGDDWAIWRWCDQDGNKERLILTGDGMDELRDYFADHYAEDRHRHLTRRVSTGLVCRHL